MSGTGPLKHDDKYHLLHEACARNISAELHLRDHQAGLITARARLLEMDSALIYVDRPQAAGQALALRSMQTVTVYFLFNGTRYAFRTRVHQPQCLVRLNARHRVPGSALGLPATVERRQRRASFRLSLAAFTGLTVAVHRGTADNGGAAPIDAIRHVARLLNLSAEGIGALFDVGATRQWKSRDVFFLAFELPEVETSFLLLAELRHMRPIRDSLSVIAGFRFLPWSLVPMESYGRELTRFIAAVERRRLRRS